jgi:hypothetical protein
MNSLPRLITFSLLLLFSVCFLFRPLQATDERAAAGPLTANNSAGVQEAAAPVHAEDSQPGASEAKPLFPVVEHGKWGYMDKAGKIVIPPQYYDAGPFKEGMARVQPWPVLLSKAIRVYFIDKSGKMLSVFKVYANAQDFSEGLALVVVPGERGFGYIDAIGNMVIPQDDSREAGGQFREGLATIKQRGKWGYIDKLGKTVIAPQYQEALRFSEGLASVKSDDKWGYIDKSGKMVIAPQYEMAYQHVEGLAAVKQDGKWGFVDTTGKMVIAPQFQETYGFSEGLAEVRVGKKWGYIDQTGKYVWAPTK